LKGLAKNKYLIAGLAIVVLLALFFILKPESKPGSSNQQQTQVEQQVSKKNFILEIRGGKLVNDSDSLRVNQGDNVAIKVTSDKADELHLHGYDKEVELEAGVPVELSFKADKSGRFVIELHKSDTEIAALEVQPQL
jgi:heme/copper-type cytochrome/quinol oxidase subunit 2